MSCPSQAQGGRWLLLWCLLALPVAAQQAPAPAPIPPAGSEARVAGPDKQKEEVTPVAADPDLLTSLFFSSVESEAIAQARRQYASRGMAEESEQDLLDQLQGIMSAKKPEEELQEKYYAQFYLESLMYHTPKDWMAWLKVADISKKFTPDVMSANDIGIKVIGVDKENITFEWKPKDWISVSNAIKQADSTIVLDQTNHTVTFTLRVNQTLSAVDMKVTEGMITLTPIAGMEDTKKTPEKPLQETSETVSKAEPSSGDDKTPASAGVLGLYKQLEPAQQP